MYLTVDDTLDQRCGRMRGSTRCVTRGTVGRDNRGQEDESLRLGVQNDTCW